jgi:hypothetical protein
MDSFLVDLMMIPLEKRRIQAVCICDLDTVDINAIDKFGGDHTRRIAFFSCLFFLFGDFDVSQAFRLLFFALAVSIAE